MSYVLPLFPTPLESRIALDDARRVVQDAAQRLADLHAASAAVAVDTDWRAPSARVFGDRVDRWRSQLDAARAHAEDVVSGLTRAAAELDARLGADLR